MENILHLLFELAQLADLVARPIGLSVIKPEQINRAFEVIKMKMYNGKFKIYP